jgi:hypothetical protein
VISISALWHCRRPSCIAVAAARSTLITLMPSACGAAGALCWSKASSREQARCVGYMASSRTDTSSMGPGHYRPKRDLLLSRPRSAVMGRPATAPAGVPDSSTGEGGSGPPPQRGARDQGWRTGGLQGGAASGCAPAATDQRHEPQHGRQQQRRQQHFQHAGSTAARSSQAAAGTQRAAAQGHGSHRGTNGSNMVLPPAEQAPATSGAPQVSWGSACCSPPNPSHRY